MNNTMKIYQDGKLIEVVRKAPMPVVQPRRRVRRATSYTYEPRYKAVIARRRVQASRNRLGSNQYQTKPRYQEDWKRTLIITAIVVAVFSFGMNRLKVFVEKTFGPQTIELRADTKAPIKPIEVKAAEPTPVVTPTPTPIPTQVPKVEKADDIDLAKLITHLFKEDAKVMSAIFRAESGFNKNAKGWNCYYFDTDGTKYSAACKPQDRAKAWSVDCGIAQNNFMGLECPEYSLDPVWSISEAYRKFTTRGFQPWYAYSNGSYLQFLN